MTNQPELPAEAARRPSERDPRLVEAWWGFALLTACAAAFVYGLVGTFGFRDVARWFPTFVTVAGLVLVLSALWPEIRSIRKLRALAGVEPGEDEENPFREDMSSTTALHFARHILWLVGLAGAMLLVGAPLAILLWLFAYLKVEGRARFWQAVLWSAIAVVVFLLGASALNLTLPQGVLLDSGRLIPYDLL